MDEQQSRHSLLRDGLGKRVSCMTKRRTLCSAGALAALAGVATGLALLVACSDSARPASSEPVAPTSSYGKPAKTLEDALSQARGRLEAGPPFADEIESAVYVETTVGRARDLFDPKREIGSGRFFTDAPADSPVWVVVAYAEFQWANRGAIDVPPVLYSTVWMVIPVGKSGMYLGASNEQYDLARLGRVVEVPVPLPPFPTPVKLNSQ